jgi:hypothetical protein
MTKQVLSDGEYSIMEVTPRERHSHRVMEVLNKFPLLHQTAMMVRKKKKKKRKERNVTRNK